MRIELISTEELGPVEQLAWRRLQEQDRAIAAPALSPHWARYVGESRADARVAVVLDGGGRTVGFLPVQTGQPGVIEPLAASLDLGCGLVGDPRLEWGAAEWLHDVGAHAFPFAGAPERQVEFARAARGPVLRLCAEIQGGAAAYARRKRERGVDVAERREQRIEALTAARGCLPRVRLFSWDRQDFDRALFWSAAALRKPQSEWEIAVLRRAFERETDEGFFGALFTLSFGGELAAGVFFLVDRRHAQLVFLGEDPGVEQHGPAAVVMVDALAALSERGVTEVDLGAVEGPIAREIATHRRHRLYGQVRPAARRRLALPIGARLRRAIAAQEWSHLGPATL